MNCSLDREYLRIVEDLLRSPEVLSMHKIKQHAEGFTCLDHSLFVSYLSYKVCKKMGLDYVSAARAGLLHDLHLCEDWSKTDLTHWQYLCLHPVMALENAERFGLNDLERDIILNHMWPVAITRIPRHRESVVVNVVDTVCATAEFVRAHKVLMTTKRLSVMSRRRMAKKLAGSIA